MRAGDRQRSLPEIEGQPVIRRMTEPFQTSGLATESCLWANAVRRDRRGPASMEPATYPPARIPNQTGRTPAPGTAAKRTGRAAVTRDTVPDHSKDLAVDPDGKGQGSLPPRPNPARYTTAQPRGQWRTVACREARKSLVSRRKPMEGIEDDPRRCSRNDIDCGPDPWR